VTLSYEPGNSVAHRLDPRTKLAAQFGVALAAVSHTTPRGFAVLTVVAALALWAAALSPIEALWEVRYAFPFLVAGPVVAGFTLGPPWIALEETVPAALSSYRVVVVLAVSVAAVHTTPARDSRAAIQHTIPGRAGQLLGIGVSLVFRFLPVLIADLSRARVAMRARLGTERPLVDRIRIVTIAGVDRALSRADRLGLALRARCFAWNPTLPALQFTRLDVPALALTAGLFVWALL